MNTLGEALESARHEAALEADEHARTKLLLAAEKSALGTKTELAAALEAQVARLGAEVAASETLGSRLASEVRA